MSKKSLKINRFWRFQNALITDDFSSLWMLQSREKALIIGTCRGFSVVSISNCSLGFCYVPSDSTRRTISRNAFALPGTWVRIPHPPPIKNDLESSKSFFIWDSNIFAFLEIIYEKEFFITKLKWKDSFFLISKRLEIITTAVGISYRCCFFY